MKDLKGLWFFLIVLIIVVALGSFFNIYFLKQFGDEMISSLSTREIESKLQLMSERVSLLNTNLDSLSSVEVREDLSRIITDFERIIADINYVSNSLSSNPVLDSIAQLSSDLKLIKRSIDSLDSGESVDYSTQIEGVRGKIVSLEWQVEELKKLLESSTADLKKSVMNVNAFSSQADQSYKEEVGKGVRIRIESGFKGSSILHDSDILMILNELYALRATEISLNGKRIMPYTYVRCVGATVIINDEPTQISPIVIEVLGEYDYLVSGLGLLKEFFAGREIDMTFLPLEFITIPAGGG
ncbi:MULTISPECIES: DUF881 domain-containing protein [Mesotoga]|uniref:DUF881 domain-containing protein n=1 Tax=Mesotoga TaxID=1184396 RepID=UPI002B81BE5E|nr:MULTISPECIES: DUF881 domain-containing protein [Mesotoga]HNQ71551.1 DUF881 domain-containing protein [Mesotoga prima]HNS76521.1 DUF881 domain-containing protein [Mesotoga prima]HOP38123.1 DUF881 domain-containing protein [Mesotoga prima]HPA00146.1 DUF881 domain-containing protein [Mesotoga prima]HPE54130.1 DUF881 domain-containing protein [Mesotoga prima]